MKKLSVIVVLILSLFAVPVMADMDITTPIVRASIDRFRVLEFHVVNNSAPYVAIIAEIGYVSNTVFIKVRSDNVRITNLQILHNGTVIAVADENGFIPALPAAYQVNPANVVMGHINNGTFGGNATATDYLEQIVKTLAGL